MTKTGYAEKHEIERLKKTYEKNVIKKDGCWDWTNRLLKAKGKKPQMRNGKEKYPSVSRCQVRIHRLSWIIHRGPIPDDMFVLHHCDNPRCSRPEHLYLGTAKNNALDRSNRDRSNTITGDRHYFARLCAEKVIKIKKLLIESDLSLTKIGKLFNVSRATISNIRDSKTWKHVIVSSNGIEIKERKKVIPHKVGEDHPISIITEKQAKEIKYLLGFGIPAAKIKRYLNISKYVIYDIKRGRTWKHIE